MSASSHRKYLLIEWQWKEKLLKSNDYLQANAHRQPHTDTGYNLRFSEHLSTHNNYNNNNNNKKTYNKTIIQKKTKEEEEKFLFFLCFGIKIYGFLIKTKEKMSKKNSEKNFFKNLPVSYGVCV